MQRLAGERIKYAVSNDKSKNAGYMGVSHYILHFVYSFLYILLLMYGKGFMFYLTMRFTKNLIQLPINIFLTYNVIGIVK